MTNGIRASDFSDMTSPVTIGFSTTPYPSISLHNPNFFPQWFKALHERLNPGEKLDLAKEKGQLKNLWTKMVEAKI